MRKIITTGILWSFFISSVFPQDIEFGGGRFVKRVEYNLIVYEDGYNVDSKGEIEKLFFGDFNALVEFSFLPSSEAAFVNQPSGFRIVKGKSKTSYVLEVKYISNYEEAQEEASKNYPISLGMSAEQNHKYMLKLLKVETKSFPVSNQFAEKLYEKMVLLIDNFKAKGVPPMILDGYSVVFRNVVEDEVWSLSIHMPKGDALKMADLCRQIITDADAKKPDESKYLSVLETFE